MNYGCGARSLRRRLVLRATVRAIRPSVGWAGEAACVGQTSDCRAWAGRRRLPRVGQAGAAVDRSRPAESADRGRPLELAAADPAQEAARLLGVARPRGAARDLVRVGRVVPSHLAPQLV